MPNPCIEICKSELARLGIRDVMVARGGKHPQLQFKINGGPVHVFAVPSTPSDHRAPANVRTSLRRYLAEAGVDLNLSAESKQPERTPSRLELLERRVAELERRLGSI
jgi:hypothetical protein